MSVNPPKQLSQFTNYILGRHPEAFGLVPDIDGYVAVKTLLKVFSEEDGWRHVRLGHLKEALLTLADPGFEIEGGRVRACRREHLPMPEPATAMPKTVYTFIRRKAHASVVEKGLYGAEAAPIVVCRDRSLAERLGLRLDRSPVPLVINTALAQASGASFWTAGEGLFTATWIPAGCFSAPPLPAAATTAGAGRKPDAPKPMPTPGSFTIDSAAIALSVTDSGQKRKGQKDKRRRQPPPWRR